MSKVYFFMLRYVFSRYIEENNPELFLNKDFTFDVLDFGTKKYN
jgi:hypothetical protein